MEKQVARLVKCNGLHPSKWHRPHGPDSIEPRLDRFRINLLRNLAAQAQDDSPVRTVAFACQGERTIEVNLHPSNRDEHTLRSQHRHEIGGRAHRSHRVGARRSDPDFEDLKNARFHACPTAFLKIC